MGHMQNIKPSPDPLSWESQCIPLRYILFGFGFCLVRKAGLSKSSCWLKPGGNGQSSVLERVAEA